MKTHHQFYINGEWVDPAEGVNSFDVINPSNEEVIAQIALGTPADVDKAVTAASSAFDSFSQTSVCLLYTSPSPRDAHESRMPSSA